MKVLLNLQVISAFIFVAGCQSIVIPTEKATTPVSTREAVPTLLSEFNEGIDMSEPTIYPDPQAQKMVQLAKESLARKFKVSEDQIYLFSVEAMIWPDASLECPQAGIIYAQVLTPGYQILFEAKGGSYSYHTDDISRVILCRIHPPDNIFPTPQ